MRQQLIHCSNFQLLASNVHGQVLVSTTTMNYLKRYYISWHSQYVTTTTANINGVETNVKILSLPPLPLSLFSDQCCNETEFGQLMESLAQVFGRSDLKKRLHHLYFWNHFTKDITGQHSICFERSQSAALKKGNTMVMFKVFKKTAIMILEYVGPNVHPVTKNPIAGGTPMAMFLFGPLFLDIRSRSLVKMNAVKGEFPMYRRGSTTGFKSSLAELKEVNDQVLAAIGAVN